MDETNARELLSADPFASHLGASLLSEDPLTVGMTVGPHHTNFRGTAHGAAIYGLADVVLSLLSNADTPSFMIDSHLVATRRAEQGDVLTATGREITAGKTLATYHIEVTNDAGRTVAIFTGTVIRR